MKQDTSQHRGGEATVVKNAGSHFLLSRLPEWKLFPAVLRGKVRLEHGSATNPVAVGDRVRYTVGEIQDETHPAVITEVLPRRNYLIRRSTNLSRQSHVIAANLDQVLVTVSLYFPEIKLPFLDRILVTCEVYGIQAVILLNKIDMYGSEVPEQVEDFVRTYRQAGYPVIPTSALTGEGIGSLRELCREILHQPQIFASNERKPAARFILSCAEACGIHRPGLLHCRCFDRCGHHIGYQHLCTFKSLGRRLND